ncbi:MAG TPA: bifunctional diguanylate cyclase/phosphodiesterase [Solirubrobacteraceae bacterium]|jgi:diguanylate cyclase (GGDEF)-like protein
MSGRRERPDRQRREPDLRPIPASFDVYAAAVAVLAALLVVLAVTGGGWHGALSDPRFWALAALVVGGELLPIQVPNRFSYDSVTVSSGFAYAVLLEFGLLPALAVYALAAVVADRTDRVPAVISVFNVGQYALAIGAAAGVHALAGGGVPVTSVASGLTATLAGGVAFFAVNHVLAGAASAQLTGQAIGPYLRADLGYQVWTAGFQLALAPLTVLAAQASPWLIPLTCIPVAAIYLGGRQATINEYRAAHDVLTDLPNRWMLTRRLEELAGREPDARGDGALVLIDLDDFKLVNDTLGHHSGDVLLQLLAERMRGALRREDLLARLGGDEFAVLLEPAGAAAGASGGMEVAERLLTALDAPFEVDGLALDVTASAGVAAIPAGADPRDVLRQADVALYEAKELGSGHAGYSPAREQRGADRLALSRGLRSALDGDEIFVLFQPKVSLSGTRPQGAEALARWRHPERGVVGPADFVRLAEETGLIKALTLRVLELAIAQASEWHRAGRAIRVAVNLSARNLLDRGLPADVAALLAAHGLPPRLLQLEVTESRVVTDIKRSRSVLEELRAMGITIAIDDFGTGFSSLSQLQHLPVDEIKIDKSFVLGMDESRQDAAIVRSTIDLGRSLDLAVTAEGVETAGVLAQLAELGCDCLQGFYIGRPEAAGDCLQVLDGYAGADGLLAASAASAATSATASSR